MFKALEYPSEHEECQSLNAEDEFKDNRELDEKVNKEREKGEYMDTQPPEQSCVVVHTSFEPLNINPRNQRSKPSLKQALELELKVLPTHLKYVYLGDGNTLPVIISSALSLEHEFALLNVLTKYIRAIGWTLADIRGISPTSCMHKIRLEEGKDKPIKLHRRLNPTMKEVVKKEILKWLGVGIIFPTSDSKWVSPVQCIMKKG